MILTILKYWVLTPEQMTYLFFVLDAYAKLGLTILVM